MTPLERTAAAQEKLNEILCEFNVTLTGTAVVADDGEISTLIMIVCSEDVDDPPIRIH